MWTSYGRRQSSLAAPLERLVAPLARAERWYGPVAIVVLWAYPNPLIPLALGGLTLSLAGRLGHRPMVARGAALDVGCALFSVGALMGLLVAQNREAALLRITGLLAGVALLHLVAGLLRSEAALLRWTATLLSLVGIGALLVLGLLQGQLPDSALARALGPFSRLFAGFPRISGDTLDVNTRFAVHQYGLAHLLLVVGVFAVAAIALGPSRRLRAGGLIALVGLTPLLLATQARGAIVALAIAASAIAALRTRWAWAILPLGGALFYILLARGTISRSIELEWLGQRLSYWSGTLGLLGDFPLSGAGLGMRTFAEVFAWYHGLPDPYVVSHTHNIYLQAYAEQGLLGLVGLLAIVILGVGIGFRAARRTFGPTRWAVAGAAGALLGSAIYGLTDQVPSTNLGLALTFGLLAIVVGGDRLATQPLPDPSPTPPRRGEGLSRVPKLLIALLLGVGAVVLAPRWTSGLLLNWGSAELVGAALDRSRDGEGRAARLATAEWALGAATRWNPASVPAQRNLGWARLLRHDVPGAHAALEAAYRPGLTPFERAQLARLARESGRLDLAVILLKQGDDETRLLDLAAQLWGARRWHDAALAYAALTELNPGEAEYVSNTAIAVLNGGGDAEEALGLLREAIAKNPGAARNLARQLVLRGEPCRSDERRGGGRFECAHFWFSLASQVDPTYDRPEVELGSIFYYRGLYADAAAHFHEASRRDPRNPSTYSQLGDSYLKLDRADVAVGFYERAVQLRPDRPDPHVNLARAYLRAGRPADALREYHAAVDLAPDNAALRGELQQAEGER